MRGDQVFAIEGQVECDKEAVVESCQEPLESGEENFVQDFCAESESKSEGLEGAEGDHQLGIVGKEERVRNTRQSHPDRNSESEIEHPEGESIAVVHKIACFLLIELIDQRKEPKDEDEQEAPEQNRKGQVKLAYPFKAEENLALVEESISQIAHIAPQEQLEETWVEAVPSQENAHSVFPDAPEHQFEDQAQQQRLWQGNQNQRSHCLNEQAIAVFDFQVLRICELCVFGALESGLQERNFLVVSEYRPFEIFYFLHCMEKTLEEGAVSAIIVDVKPEFVQQKHHGLDSIQTFGQRKYSLQNFQHDTVLLVLSVFRKLSAIDNADVVEHDPVGLVCVHLSLGECQEIVSFPGYNFHPHHKERSISNSGVFLSHDLIVPQNRQFIDPSICTHSHNPPIVTDVDVAFFFQCNFLFSKTGNCGCSTRVEGRQFNALALVEGIGVYRMQQLIVSKPVFADILRRGDRIFPVEWRNWGFEIWVLDVVALSLKQEESGNYASREQNCLHFPNLFPKQNSRLQKYKTIHDQKDVFRFYFNFQAEREFILFLKTDEAIGQCAQENSKYGHS